jgi:hypothetical protein
LSKPETCLTMAVQLTLDDVLSRKGGLIEEDDVDNHKMEQPYHRAAVGYQYSNTGVGSGPVA